MVEPGTLIIGVSEDAALRSSSAGAKEAWCFARTLLGSCLPLHTAFSLENFLPSVYPICQPYPGAGRHQEPSDTLGFLQPGAGSYASPEPGIFPQ